MQSPIPEPRFLNLIATTPTHQALTQCEHAQLRRALAARPTINMAEGALAVLGPVPLDDTAQILTALARTLDLDVHTVAVHVLSLIQGLAVPGTVIDGLHRVLARYRL